MAAIDCFYSSLSQWLLHDLSRFAFILGRRWFVGEREIACVFCVFWAATDGALENWK